MPVRVSRADARALQGATPAKRKRPPLPDPAPSPPRTRTPGQWSEDRTLAEGWMDSNQPIDGTDPVVCTVRFWHPEKRLTTARYATRDLALAALSRGEWEAL